MSLLSEALTYHSMGWGVYPSHRVDLATGSCSCGQVNCPSPGKHPIGYWIDFQRRLPTQQEVKLWFSSLDCNIGTITGSISNIVVIDVDGQKGLDSLKKLKLGPTLTAKTGGGGRHLFYYIDKKPVAGRIGVLDGIDIRGEGGYVVLSPSIHKSGNRYEWLDPRKLARFDYEYFEQFSVRSRHSEWDTQVMEGVPQGVRSITAARLAGRYFGLGLSLNETWILVREWNENNVPPLELYELKKTVLAIQKKHDTESVPIAINNLSQIKFLLEGAEVSK
jgi:hypothetical protein